MTRTQVKERTEELTTEMDEQQKSAIRILANDLHRLNQAVMKAVETGLSVELQRTARHHTDGGYWGDLLMPIIVKQKQA